MQLGIEQSNSLPKKPLTEEEKCQVLKDRVSTAFADQVAPTLIMTIFLFDGIMNFDSIQN